MKLLLDIDQNFPDILKDLAIILNSDDADYQIHEYEDTINLMLISSDFKCRPINLANNKISLDQGDLLVCKIGSDKLIPLRTNGRGRYKIYNFLTQKWAMATQEDLEDLETQALVFYHQLPKHTLSWKDLAIFIRHELKGNLAVILAFNFIFMFVGILSAALLGYVVATIIPDGDYPLLKEIVLVLLITTISGIFFLLGQSVSFVRIKAKSQYQLQLAIWDRLLRLPSTFFKNYSTGDIAFRASSFTQAQNGITINSLLSITNGLLSLFMIIVLFSFNTAFGDIAIIIFLFMSLATYICCRYNLYYLQKYYKIDLYNHALFLQIVQNIAKIRVGNKEEYFSGLWLGNFIKKAILLAKAGLPEKILQTLLFVIPHSLIIVLIMTLYIQTPAIQVSEFVFLFGVLEHFIMALTSMYFSITSLVSLVPHANCIKPIIEAQPTNLEGLEIVGELSGHIEFSRITFGYTQTQPILREASFVIKPGEFIGLIGVSGGGKSTILKLLLGLETPQSGRILYDNVDLKNINIQRLRQQIGTLMQSSTLTSGTLLENIRNFNLKITEQEILDALAQFDMLDFIKELPMGLHTIVTDSGKTFSAGQRQSILLARIFLQKPKIIFLDESTSALDSIAQKRFSKMLDETNATRIIIAHRTETLKKADQIFELVNGKLLWQKNSGL